MSEETIGICGYCHAVGGYHPSNMLLMADRPDIDWVSKPDVYAGDTWFCQGCGCSTAKVISLERAEGLIR